MSSMSLFTWTFAFPFPVLSSTGLLPFPLSPPFAPVDVGGGFRLLVVFPCNRAGSAEATAFPAGVFGAFRFRPRPPVEARVWPVGR